MRRYYKLGGSIAKEVSELAGLSPRLGVSNYDTQESYLRISSTSEEDLGEKGPWPAGGEKAGGGRGREDRPRENVNAQQPVRRLNYLQYTN